MIGLLTLLALTLFTGVLALPSAGHAALRSNHAYRSPSTRVRHLQVDTDTVVSRLGKRWSETYQGNLTFPYGVASGDREFIK